MAIFPQEMRKWKTCSDCFISVSFKFGGSSGMINHKEKLSILLIMIMMLTSLTAAKSVKKSLEISLREKMIQDLSGSGLLLVYYVDINNSSSDPIHLLSYDYRFMVSNKEYLRVKTNLENPIRIKAKGTTLISLPLKITYELLFQVIPELETEDKAVCYISGNLLFSYERKKGEGIPFTFSGEFPIFREPMVEFLALRVNDLTIGGADLLFQVKFKNYNGFELLVDKLSYNLYLEENLIREGMIAGDKSIAKKGEKIFSLSLLINFYEVGKQVHDVLQRHSSLCRFYGEVEVTTIWGRIKIPFEKRENITISKAH